MDHDDQREEQSSAPSLAARADAQTAAHLPTSASEIAADGRDQPPREWASKQASKQAGDSPTVGRQDWLKQDDYWQRTTYTAITGRHSGPPRRTRALPRPRRFRKPAPIRSALALVLTLALIVLIPIGVVLAQREAQAHIKLPTTIPGLTEPTPTHTPHPTTTATVKPTATPKSHK